MRKIIAGLLALAVWTSPALSQYVPYEVDFADGSLSAPLNTSVGNTPTIRVYYKQNGTNFNPSSYESYLKWGKDDSSVDGMVTVPGVNNTNGYSDFFCASNTFGKVVKDGYWSVYLTRSNGTQNITAIRAAGGLQVERSPEISNALALQRTTAINWDLLVNTGTLPWVAFAIGANTDVLARINIGVLSNWVVGVSNTLSDRIGALNFATGTPVYAESDPVWVGASNLYYTKVLADAKFATGTPVYVESDPLWASVSNRFRIGTNVLADMSGTNLSYNGVGLRDGVGSGGGGASSPTGTISVNHIVVTSTNQTTPADASQIELLEGNGQIAGRIFYQRDVADSNHYILGFTHNASLTNGAWAVDNNALPASRLGLENYYNNGSRRAHEFNWDVDNAGGSGAEFRRIFNIYAYSDGSNNDAAATFFVPRFWFQSNSGGLTSLIVSSASDPALYGAGWPYIRTAQDLGGLHKYGMVIGAGYGHLYLQHDVGNTNHVFMAVPDANRVGIGTTNATSKLTVAGDISAERLYVSSIVSTNNQFNNTNDLSSEFSWIDGNRNRFNASFFQPGFTNGFGFLGGGGYSNAWLMSAAQGTMLAGGMSNSAISDISGAASVGGFNNFLNGSIGSIMGGGRGNTMSGNYSAMLGGQGDTLSGGWSVMGGRENVGAANYTATFGYQNQNQSGAQVSTIAGGSTNVIAGAFGAFIGAGTRNLIGSGGTYGTIPGGTSNQVLAAGGFAAGNAAVVSATGTNAFIWNGAQLAYTNALARSAVFNVPGGFMVVVGSTTFTVLTNGTFGVAGTGSWSFTESGLIVNGVVK